MANGKREESLVKIFADGELIVAEGEISTEMYIVQEGAVVVSKKTKNGDLILGELGRGDFFGEMAMLESMPRNATVRAKGTVKVVVLHSGGFLLKLRRDPTFAFEVIQHLSGRVRRLNETIVRMIDGQPVDMEAVASMILLEQEGVPTVMVDASPKVAEEAAA